MEKKIKKIRKVLNEIRRMNYWQRILIMNWLNDWYSDYKMMEEE